MKRQKTLAEGRLKTNKMRWLFVQIITKLNLPQDVVDPEADMSSRVDSANS